MFKKVLIGSSIALVLFAGTTHANGVENKSTTIKKITKDVTGDKKADIIMLKGKKGKNGYYDNLYVEINNKAQKKTLKMKLNEGGTKPNLKLKDFNQDKIQDIHVTLKNKSYQMNHVFTAKNNETVRLDMSAKIKSAAQNAANYSFKIPEKWNNHFKIKTLEGNKALKEDAYAQFITTFYYKNGKAVNEPLLSIISYKQEDWDKMKKEGGPLPELIDQTEKFVYVAQLPQSNPFDPANKDGKNFEKMVLSFEEIESAFTVNK